MAYTNPNTGLTYSTPTEKAASGYKATNGDTLVANTAINGGVTNTTKTPIAIDGLNTTTAGVVTAGTTPIVGNTGLQAAITGNNESIKTQRQIDAANAQTQVNNDQTSILKLIEDIGNKGAIEEDIYKKLEIDTKRKKVDEYSSQIEQEQLANRRQIDEIKKNSIGMSEFGLNSEITKINDLSISRQADYAILQSAANRDYSTAATIAERQVEAKLEPMRAKIEARKFFYENNKSILDKADAALLREEERVLDNKEKELNTIKDIKLKLAQNGAPASVLNSLSKALTLDDALSTPGINSYFTSPADKLDLQLKKLQIAKARNDLSPRKGLDLNSSIPADKAIELGVPIGTTYAEYNALKGVGGLNENQAKVLQSTNNLISKIDSAKIVSNLPVGSGKFAGINLPGSKRSDFVNNYDNLRSLLTIDSLKLLKGSMSDKDVAFLMSASTELNRNQSLTAFKTTLQGIQQTLQKASPDYQYAQAAVGVANSNQQSVVSSYTSSLLNQ